MLVRISYFGPGLAVCPASGVSSSTVSAAIIAGGHVDATATVAGGAINVALSGTATTGTFVLNLSARVNAQIPQLGAPSSPV